MKIVVYDSRKAAYTEDPEICDTAFDAVSRDVMSFIHKEKEFAVVSFLKLDGAYVITIKERRKSEK